MSEAIEISKLLDKYLPANGVGTERERIRMEMYNDISMLFKNLTIPRVSNRYSIEDIERCVENWGMCNVEKEYIERFLNGA
jgi:hypothetical protein